MAVTDTTYSDVKAYLGISVDTYDTQITAIAATWNAILNTQILSEYFNDSTLESLIEGAKLLCIAGQTQNRMAMSTMGLTSSKFTLSEWSEDNSSSSSNATQVGAKNPLYEEGMKILKPYMSVDSVLSLSDSPLSSNSGYYPEFQISKYDEDGNVVSGEEGTMGVF